MRKTVNVLGIPVDSVTIQEAVEIFNDFLTENARPKLVFTPNAEIMMAAQRDSELAHILASSDLLVADGAGVVLSSKILGRPVPERVAGFDLMCSVLEAAKNAKSRALRVFLFGAAPEVVKTASEAISSKYNNVVVAGISDGYGYIDREESIIESINSSNSDILFVALGAPRQEKWIYKNMSKLSVRVCMGVGGSFDVLSGKSKRAPLFFQKHGLEWLYRLYKEPHRFIRMLDLPRFVVLSIYARLTGIKT